MLGKYIIEATEATFTELVEQAPGLVVVDLWAIWCGPCQILAPTLDAVAQQYPDIRVVSVDITENPAIATKYSVRSVPTVLYMLDGQVVERAVGVVPRKDLEARIEHWMSEKSAIPLP